MPDVLTHELTMSTLSHNLGQCTWRYALVNGKRTDIVDAEIGVHGVCPLCNAELAPRKGKIRNWHWYHVSGRQCDDWYEAKGRWHRAWQAQFDEEWQEVPVVKTLADETTKHIADVKTPNGWTIEFQYSHISVESVKAREDFYGSMVWVVSGTRLKKDWQYGKDLLSRNDCLQTEDGWKYLELKDCHGFNQSWRDRDKLVFFDFCGTLDEPSGGMDLLCLIPGEVEGARLLVRVSQVDFVRGCRSGHMQSFITRLLRCKQSYVKHLETIGYLDKSVSYALTLEPVDGWLIAHEYLKKIQVNLKGVDKIAVKGRCAIHLSSYLNPQSYWWSKKKRMDGGIAESILEKVPSESVLKQHVNEFIGVASYIKKGTSETVSLELADFKWLKHRFKGPHCDPSMWHLERDLKQRIKQQICESDEASSVDMESRGTDPCDPVDVIRSVR